MTNKALPGNIQHGWRNLQHGCRERYYIFKAWHNGINLDKTVWRCLFRFFLSILFLAFLFRVISLTSLFPKRPLEASHESEALLKSCIISWVGRNFSRNGMWRILWVLKLTWRVQKFSYCSRLILMINYHKTSYDKRDVCPFQNPWGSYMLHSLRSLRPSLAERHSIADRQ